MNHAFKKIISNYTDWNVIIFTLVVFLKVSIFHMITDLTLNRINVFLSFGILFFLMSIGGVLFKKKLRVYLYTMNFLISVLLFVNLLYMNYFGSPMTVYTFMQIHNLNGLSDSILSVIELEYFVLFADFTILPILFKYVPPLRMPTPRSIHLLYATGGILVAVYYPYHLYSVNEKAFEARYDASEVLKTYGLIGHHMIDTYAFLNERNGVELRNAEKAEIKAWYKEKNEAEINANSSKDNESLYSFAKDKNLIMIQVESLQNFVINEEVDGQEITPTLNGMLDHSLYFPSFYAQTIEGNSSDAEFLTQTSLYPLQKGAVFFRFPHHNFVSVASMLKEEGYSTSVFHADEATFWNRHEMYPALGFDRYYSISNFEMDEEIGMGLSDMSMFQQSLNHLDAMESPIYAFYGTLTNHVPFNLPEQHRKLKLNKELDSSYIGDYLQSVHYTDIAIGKFLEGLKEKGLLQDSLVVLYGDHDGLFQKDKPEVEKYWTKSPIDDEEWIREFSPVPLIIYHPDLAGKTIPVTGGQVDVLPTLHYLMGMERDISNSAMGRNLLFIDEGFAIIPKGDYAPKPLLVSDQAIINPLPDHHSESLYLSDLMIRANYFKHLKKQDD
ncbi:LTA synthase family protein [Thalassobacillus hwangdonensis]|uniref:LTA synthase family protein n=1 Tax=Thalassobacillus hwangdonensis TaxID=546108 RepID=A0ABW3KVH6_9BACI